MDEEGQLGAGSTDDSLGNPGPPPQLADDPYEQDYQNPTDSGRQDTTDTLGQSGAPSPYDEGAPSGASDTTQQASSDNLGNPGPPPQNDTTDQSTQEDYTPPRQPRDEPTYQDYREGSAYSDQLAAQDQNQQYQDKSDDLLYRIEQYKENVANGTQERDPNLEGSFQGELNDLANQGSQLDTSVAKARQSAQDYQTLLDQTAQDQRQTAAYRQNDYTGIAQQDTLGQPGPGEIAGQIGADLLPGAINSPELRALWGGESSFTTPSGQTIARTDDGQGYGGWTIPGADDPNNVLYNDNGNWRAVSRTDAQNLLNQGASPSQFTSVTNAQSIAGQAMQSVGETPQSPDFGARALQSLSMIGTAVTMPVSPGLAFLDGVTGAGGILAGETALDTGLGVGGQIGAQVARSLGPTATTIGGSSIDFGATSAAARAAAQAPWASDLGLTTAQATSAGLIPSATTTGLGIIGGLKFDTAQFVGNAILNGLPEKVPGTNIPIPDMLQHLGGALTDNPGNFVHLVNNTFGAIFDPRMNVKLTDIQTLANNVQQAFHQDPVTYWRQQGLQKELVPSVYIGSLGLNYNAQNIEQGRPPITIDPHNQATKFQQEFDWRLREGVTPEQAAMDAVQAIHSQVGDWVWTLNPWNPAYGWLRAPAAEALLGRILERPMRPINELRSISAATPVLNSGLIRSAEETTAALGRRPLDLSLTNGAEMTTNIIADRFGSMAPSRLQEFATDVLGVSKSLENDMAQASTQIGGMGRSGAFVSDATQQLANQVAQKWGGITDDGVISLAGVWHDGLARSVEAPAAISGQAAAQVESLAIQKAIDQRIVDIQNLTRESPEFRRAEYRAISSPAQVGEGPLMDQAVKQMFTADARRYFYDLAGAKLPSDANLAVKMVNTGMQTLSTALRAAFLVAGAPAIAIQKILDEAVRASTQGVYGFFGIRPYDMALPRGLARAASYSNIPAVEKFGDFLSARSVQNKYLANNIPLPESLLRDAKVNGWWNAVKGVSPYGEKLSVGQRLAAANPLGVANRAIDKFLNVMIQSPTQHIMFNAANKALIEQAGGMAAIKEAAIRRMAETPGIAPKDIADYVEGIRTARSMGEFKNVLDDYTAKYRPDTGTPGTQRGFTGPPFPGGGSPLPIGDMDILRGNRPTPTNGNGNGKININDLRQWQSAETAYKQAEQRGDQAAMDAARAQLERFEASGGHPLPPETENVLRAARQLEQANGGTFSFKSNGAMGLNEHPSLRTSDRAVYEQREMVKDQMLANGYITRAGNGEYQLTDKALDVLGEKPRSGVPTQTLFHGSGTEGITPQTIRAGKTAENGLFGPGIYLTDNRQISQTYANLRSKQVAQESLWRTGKYGDETPVVYEAGIQPKNILNVEDHIPPGVRRVADEFAQRYNNTALYQDFQKASTVEDLYTSLKHTDRANHPYNLKEFNHDLKAAGYDALEYTGGIRTGGEEHRALVLLEPETGANPVSAFTPTYSGGEVGDTILKGEVPRTNPTLDQQAREWAAQKVGQTFGGAATPIEPLGTPGRPGDTPEYIAQYNANRQMLARTANEYTRMQQQIPIRAEQLQSRIIGNPMNQTNVGSALRNGVQIKGMTVFPAIIPFANFHIHTTEFWMRFFAEHPLMPLQIAQTLAQSGMDEYGYLPNGTSGVTRMSTAAHLIDWGMKAFSYFNDLRQNPNGNNAFQQFAKNAAYNTVGNNPFVSTFPEEQGLLSGVVQSTTNPLLNKKGTTDNRDILKERGAENWLQGGMNLAGINRNVSAVVGGAGNWASNKLMGAGVGLVNRLGGNANIKPYNVDSDLPYLAVNFAQLHPDWSRERVDTAIKNPQTPDGKLFRDWYNQQHDYRALETISPIRQRQEEATSGYVNGIHAQDQQAFADVKAAWDKFQQTGLVEDRNAYFDKLKTYEEIHKQDKASPLKPFYQDQLQGGTNDFPGFAISPAGYDGGINKYRAGEGGTDTTRTNPFRLEQTARNQLELGRSPSVVPIADYARDYLQRTGYQPPTPNMIESRLLMKEDALQKQIEGNAKYTGAGLPQDQRTAFLTKENGLDTPIDGKFTVRDFLSQPGNLFDAEQRLSDAVKAGDKAGERQAIRDINDIKARDLAQHPEVKAYLDTLKTYTEPQTPSAKNPGPYTNPRSNTGSTYRPRSGSAGSSRTTTARTNARTQSSAASQASGQSAKEAFQATYRALSSADRSIVLKDSVVATVLTKGGSASQYRDATARIERLTNSKVAGTGRYNVSDRGFTPTAGTADFLAPEVLGTTGQVAFGAGGGSTRQRVETLGAQGAPPRTNTRNTFQYYNAPRSKTKKKA